MVLARDLCWWYVQKRIATSIISYQVVLCNMKSTDLPEVLALFTFYVSYRLFFLLVARIYFYYFVNWLAGYHVYKTLQVSSVRFFSPL
jgi:hypothetical protein